MLNPLTKYLRGTLKIKMTKKINIKTKALYIGCYDFEDESHSNWMTFVYSSSASDDELKKYFRNTVYKSEYGEKLDRDAHVDIYELITGCDYSAKKLYKISLHI